MAVPNQVLPSVPRQDVLYRRLLRHALVRLVFLYFIPLLLLTLFFHVQYRLVVHESQRRHLVALAERQAAMLDMYLSDRLRNLNSLAEDQEMLQKPDAAHLEEGLRRLTQASEAFVDLTLLDETGRVLGYAGPYPFLVEKNYGAESWFVRLQTGSASYVITDIYLGFRGLPHFTMALKSGSGGGPRVLRAVLSPEKIQAYMTTLEGAGEISATIINGQGLLQVATRARDTADNHQTLPVPGSERTGSGRQPGSSSGATYAWAWLGTVPWALVTVVAESGTGITLGGLLSGMAMNIWLVSAIFCLIGGLVIWLQARWVAKQQLEAKIKEMDLSQQLFQAAKLATIGELAAGIAHEINNPLAVVAEKAGLLKDLLNPQFDRAPTPQHLSEHLAAIDKAVYRCTDITRKLLGFVRQTEVRLVERNVHDLIDAIVDGLLGPELDVADISIVKEYDLDVPPILTDPGQLSQVILNLLKNAADAITGPGEIRITTLRRGDRFTLTITDTGCGMTPDQVDRVFMPFFTTKPPGEGTGLGLSVSYKIIEGLGGQMSVRSTEGMGSEFTIDLPLQR